MIRRILIANRGEIACRVIRSARSLGIATVAVYSDADAEAMHVSLADEAVRLGPAPVAESYLKGDRIIEAAKDTHADAIHPGYGFLSENPDFVEAVEKEGLIFIGPSAEAIRAMGLKDRAKALMEEAKVPVVPGYHGDDQSPERLAEEAERIGYPVLIKARAGGGGKGMRRVDDPGAFADALQSAQREAEAAFGDPACLVEKYIEHPRHIEVQVFGDQHGTVVHLFERDCSLQRRHQKVIEEAPAPDMPEAVRAAMGAAAVRAAEAVSYAGAGTVEFIADGAGGLREDGFWFMEMNTRLQVEHPVTEAITGLDLVALQIAVAEGAPLPFAQEDLSINGHAVEARLYAEDAAAGFLPATGTLARLAFADDVRVDTGVQEGDTITPHYDPMIAKLIAHGPDRASAFRALHRALEKTRIAGTVTNRAFLARLVSDEDVMAGRVDTGLIARKQEELTAQPDPAPADYAAAALALAAPPARDDHPATALPNFRLWGAARQAVPLESGDEIVLETTASETVAITPSGDISVTDVARDGDRVAFTMEGRRTSMDAIVSGGTVTLQSDGNVHVLRRRDPAAGSESESGDTVLAPMPGSVRQVRATSGDHVNKGQTLIVLEAMKMEHTLSAPRDGKLAEVMVAEGDQVAQGAILARLEEE